MQFDVDTISIFLSDADVGFYGILQISPRDWILHVLDRSLGHVEPYVRTTFVFITYPALAYFLTS